MVSVPTERLDLIAHNKAKGKTELGEGGDQCRADEGEHSRSVLDDP